MNDKRNETWTSHRGRLHARQVRHQAPGWRRNEKEMGWKAFFPMDVLMGKGMLKVDTGKDFPLDGRHETRLHRKRYPKGMISLSNLQVSIL